MKPNISVVMPAYNEEGNLGIAVEKAVKVLDDIADKYEIIIVDDGSRDKTGEIAEVLSKKHKNVRVIHHKVNKGYGVSQKTGFSNARFEWITLVPSDNQFDMGDMRRYIGLMDTADVIMGYRIRRRDSFIRRMNARIYWTGISVLFFIPVHRDIDWVKFYRKEVLDSIDIGTDSAFADAEIIIKAHRKGFKIKEVGVPHYRRLKGKETGGDIRVIARQLFDLFKFRLGFRLK